MIKRTGAMCFSKYKGLELYDLIKINELGLHDFKDKKNFSYMI